MTLTLIVWRQRGPHEKGQFETYTARNITPEHSFLEMLDVVNEELVRKGKEPIAFDHDCREGICGMCSMVVNGIAHGGHDRTTVCQLHMRKFNDGDAIYIEPWRARAFPILFDLVTDRSAFDKIIEAGGYISCHTGGVPDGNNTPIPKATIDYAMDAAQCIGCGACVAACPNGAAMLFAGSKISHLVALPQGQAEAPDRVASMVKTMQECGFGNCSNHYECEVVCPKGIHTKFISRMNREFLKALFKAKAGVFTPAEK